MNEILSRLGPAPRQYSCMNNAGAIDMADLVLLTPFSRNNLEGFCTQINRMLEQAQCVINGYYGDVGRRAEWFFWAPIYSPSEAVTEVVFGIGKNNEDIVTYTLCFHGEFGRALQRCVLLARVNDARYPGAVHLAHPVPYIDDEGCAGRYILSIKGSIDHTLELCPG